MKKKHSCSKKEEARLKARILAEVNQGHKDPWVYEPPKKYLLLKPKMKGTLELADAEVPGRPMVSIMVVEDDNIPDGVTIEDRVPIEVAVIHLDVQEARRVIAGLQRYIRHVTNPKYYRNCRAYRGAYAW